MNDRIKQLADEATSYADTLDVADQRIYQKIRDREFAELIVRECLDIVNRHEYSYHEADPLWETAQLIKERFGVEE
jgi:hypothetical protein